eukprot:2290019-Prymnesium_polylepis.1
MDVVHGGIFCDVDGSRYVRVRGMHRGACRRTRVSGFVHVSAGAPVAIAVSVRERRAVGDDRGAVDVYGTRWKG